MGGRSTGPVWTHKTAHRNILEILQPIFVSLYVPLSMVLFQTIFLNYVLTDVRFKMGQYIMLRFIIDGVFQHVLLASLNLVIMKLKHVRKIV